jgi:hypothetical protein
MNELERRRLEIAQNHLDLLAVAHSFSSDPIIEHFGYTIQIGSVAVPLADGVTQQGVIQIQSDAYFVLQYITSCVIKPDTPQYMQQSGNVDLQITDTGSGHVLYNTPQRGGILTGTATRGLTGWPLLVPIPRVLLPNTNVKIEATQRGVNGTDNQPPVAFFVSLLGSRVLQV